MSVEQLGALCKFLNGGTPSKAVQEYFMGDIPWITGADITSATVTHARSFITKEAIDNSATNLVARGTVLLVTRTSVGKVAQAGMPLCFSQDITAIIPDRKRLHARYLARFLESQTDYLDRHSRGATIRGITREVVESLHIPLPPMEEQRRIAAILDQAEALRAKRRQALAKLDTLTQSLFLEMFGDPATNPKGTNVEPLGKHLQFITSGGRGWAKFYSAHGSRFIRSLDVQMNHIGEDDVVYVEPPDNAEARRTKVQAGDVLLTITGSQIGRVATASKNLDGAYISQHVAILRIKPGGVDPDFLSFFLSLEAGGQRQISASQYGQTKPGLNFEQIQRFVIPVPPLNQQREFHRRLSLLEMLKTAGKASLANQDSLFASIQSRTFRGEL